MKQKVISTLLAFSMIFVSLTTQTACETKCQTKLLADLLFSIAQVAVPQVAIGTPLIINSVLKNLEEECEAEKAAPTNRGIKAQYKPDANNGYADVMLQGNNGQTYEVIIPNNALGSNETDSKNDAFKFSTPGIYKFIYSADRYNQVLERNESNNITNSNNGTVKSIGVEEANGMYQLTVTVYDPTGQAQPNYEYKTKPTILEYLGDK